MKDKRHPAEIKESQNRGKVSGKIRRGRKGASYGRGEVTVDLYLLRGKRRLSSFLIKCTWI